MSLRRYSANAYSTRSYNNGTSPNSDPSLVRFLLKCTHPNTFTDVTGSHTVTNVGSVTTSTATAKFANTASASVTGGGGGNHLSVADAAFLRPGTDSFTWEFWWYPTSLTSYRSPIAKGYVSAGDLLLQTGNGDGKLVVYTSGSAVISGSIAVTVNTWNHVALVRNGTAMALYINGSSAGTATNSTDLNGTSAIGIGNSATIGTYGAAGFIQDVRISPSAVYAAAFTPPDSLS